MREVEKMTNKEKYTKLTEYLEEIKAYNHALNLVYFDQETIVPNKAFADESKTLSKLGNIVFKKMQSPEYVNLVVDLHNDSRGLNTYQKRLVTLKYRRYISRKNITPELDYEMSMAERNSYSSWLKAKNASDYSLFKDDFKKVIDNAKLCISLREDQKETPYDTLLNDYEEGGSVKQLDEVFGRLKAAIIPLLKDIQEHKPPVRDDFLNRKVSVRKQEKFSKYLMKTIGLDMDASLLATTEHPFTMMVAQHDIRITTHFYENMVLSSIYSTIHEGGHALYAQNEGQKNYDYYINDSMTSGSHECMSRLFENMIGRSRGFIHFIYPKFIRQFKEFKDVSEEELYEAINIAKPNLIRTEADELTYGLHIIIRYEIEKMIINGDVSVDELPAIWNKKYKEYMGIDAPNDKEGILQDVHWSGASFGYFPSYALGNMYAAQIVYHMRKDFDVDAALEKGKIILFKKWLCKNAYPFGSQMDPNEWIIKVTGEPLNPQYFIDYLTEKFKVR